MAGGIGVGGFHRTLAGIATLTAILSASSPAAAADGHCINFSSAGGSLSKVLRVYARSAGIQIIFDERTVGVIRISSLRLEACPEAMLRRLLQGTGLSVSRVNGNVYVVRGTPHSAPGAGRISSAPPAEEIVVTARKRVERAIDVPIALAALSGTDLEKRGARNVADVLQEVPGVGVYDQGDGTTKITIRGVSTSLGANENGYYLDDLPFTGVTVPISPDVRAWDLDRIEVLRGPQGTLFGEGSMGGTVRILTRGADLDNWEAKANGFLSTTQGGGTNHGIKGVLNLPVVPGMFAVRLAGTRERFEGWIDDGLNGTRNLNDQAFDTVRAKARFDPTERLSITGSYWSYDGKFPGGGGIADDNGQSPRSLSLATSMRYRLHGATVRYDLDGAELFYSYSHNRFRLPQKGEFLGGDFRGDVAIEVGAHELRLASQNSGPLQWAVGTYLRNADRKDNLEFALFGIDNVDVTHSKAKALFGEASFRLPLAPIDLTAGLRYYEESLEGFESNSGLVTPDEGGAFKSVNPRFSIAWHPRADTTFYASAAKGFRAGQLQPTYSAALGQQLGIPLSAAVNQDSIWTYELGGKANMNGGQLAVEAAFYVSRWKNVAVRIPISTTGFNGLINSNGTVTKGAELSVVLRPAAGLTLGMGAAYVDATYRDAVPGTGIVDGAAVDDIAKFAASASAEYRGEIAGGVLGSARIGWQHSSPRRFVSFPGYLPGDAIDRIDARVGIEFDSLSLALFADNLTNEGGAASFRTVQQLASGLDDVVAYRLRPRTVGVELNLRFPR